MNKDKLKELLLILVTDIQNDTRDVKFITFAYVNGEVVCNRVDYET